jgi:hypothetical protein
VTLYIDTDHDGTLAAEDLLVAAATPQNGTFREVFSIPTTVRPGGMLSLLAVGTIAPDAPVGAPVGVRLSGRESVGIGRGAATLQGAGKLGFVARPLPRIIIDGSFWDWEGVAMQNDSSDASNADIDIQHYAVASDRDAVSFYLDVRGRMLGGTDVPAPSRARPSKPGPVEPVPPAAPLPLPVVTGEDTAVVFVDTDRNASTGIAAAGLGADFAVQVSGRDGRVLSSAFYRAGADGNWSLAGAAPAAVDDRRLETQLTLDQMGISATAVDAVMYATDWLGARDYTPEVRGRGGTLSVEARSLAPPVAVRGSAWPMMALTLTADGGAVQVLSLRFQLEGTASGADAPSALLFADTDGDGVFSGGDALVDGSRGDFSGRRYLCAPDRPVLVPEGGTRLLFAVLEVSEVASGGMTAGLSLPEAAGISGNAVSVGGAFPLESALATIAMTGGRSAPGAGGPEDGGLDISMYVRASRLGGDFEGGKGGSGGRAPSGGWPGSWTLVTNDTLNKGKPDALDITSISMNDNSNYIYFQIKVEDLVDLAVNDEWDFYVKVNDSTNNNFDSWYRLTLQVTDASTPKFSTSLSSYTGKQSPPGRDDGWTSNESTSNQGTSYDGTMFGYKYDSSTDTVQFYIVKSQIWGNLIGPGNSTSVYSDTWYTDSKGKWKNADRGPNGGTKNYTMVPEFQEILLPVAGSVLVFVVLRGRARSQRPRRGKRIVIGRKTA